MILVGVDESQALLSQIESERARHLENYHRAQGAIALLKHLIGKSAMQDVDANPDAPCSEGASDGSD